MNVPLRATAFRGDPDVGELHGFFDPAFQFDGDTLWTFGTSLKSAYVNTFEFMNEPPLVQLWRDDAGALQAVSRILLGTGVWFHLAAPAYRTHETAQTIMAQADAAFRLLTDRASWETVRYQSKTDDIRPLEEAGYQRVGDAEVFMTRSLAAEVGDKPCPDGITLQLLDPTDRRMMHERAMAQIDAFSTGEPTASERAWITRSLPHQIAYGTPETNCSVIAIDRSGEIVAFADPFYDRANRIGEFEPVGTRQSSRRGGLSRAVMARALQEMSENGMRTAVVRTDSDNVAAIAAYESMGFTIKDRLIRYRKQRAR